MDHVAASRTEANLKEPLEVRDGMAYTSDRPGSGIEFDDEAVQRYLA